MAIVASGKIFSAVINDNTNTYYSDAEWNARLGMGEKFMLELRATNVVTNGSVTVQLESSNDNINWHIRNNAVINANTLTNATTATCFGSEVGTSEVGGRFARFNVKLTNTTAAYIEMFCTARNAL